MVAYYRISKAGTGLGIEAQKADVARHVTERGCTLIGEYTETETGKKHDLDNRPQLRKTIAHAKRSGAILVVAKLDRLLRSTVVLSLLKTRGIRFIACDNAEANELTIDILAAVAADEVRRISARTKAALAAYKARGGALGASLPQCRNLTDEARRKGVVAAAEARSRIATESYEDILELVAEMRQSGDTLQAIADALNAEGHTTRRGKDWNATQVMRVLARA